jgi:hypothetical protein
VGWLRVRLPLAQPRQLGRARSHCTPRARVRGRGVRVRPAPRVRRRPFDRPPRRRLRLRTVHLQCHIGTDTLSLARLGASSDRRRPLPRLAGGGPQARRADRRGDRVRRVRRLLRPRVLPAHAFDLVYTGIGALGWLPSIARWADVVATLVAPAGGCSCARGTRCCGRSTSASRRPRGALPVLRDRDPVVWDDPGTYVTTSASLTASVTHEWNHAREIVIGAAGARLHPHRARRAPQRAVGGVRAG